MQLAQMNGTFPSMYDGIECIRKKTTITTWHCGEWHWANKIRSHRHSESQSNLAACQLPHVNLVQLVSSTACSVAVAVHFQQTTRPVHLHINKSTILRRYSTYQQVKRKEKYLLKTFKWCPYICKHTANNTQTHTHRNNRFTSIDVSGTTWYQ